MKKILEGLFIIGFVFIGAQVHAASTTGTVNPTTTNNNNYTFTPASRNSIKVLSPNGGETYKLGDNINISWMSSLDLDDRNAYFNLIDDTHVCQAGVTGCTNIFRAQNRLGWLSLVTPVSPGTSTTGKSNGNYLWDLSLTSASTGPNNYSKLSLGVKYKIQVCIGNVCDMSDNYFTVSDQSSLQLLSPNGGELYKVGDVMDIKWDRCVHNQYTSEKLTIYMIEPNLKYSLNIAGDVACSDGSYSYKIPSSIVGTNIGGDKYQLVISDLTGVNSFGYGQSANYFTINNPNLISPNTSNAYSAKDCQIIAYPDPATFCPTGTIELVNDTNNCTVSFKCAPTTTSPNTSNAYVPNVCRPISSPDPATFCPNGTIDPVKNANDCTIGYKCTPPVYIAPNTSNTNVCANGATNYPACALYCPVVPSPDPATFCPKGTIESVKDSKACVTSYKCVPPSIISTISSGFVTRATSFVQRITSSLNQISSSINQITGFIKKITSSLFQ